MTCLLEWPSGVGAVGACRMLDVPLYQVGASVAAEHVTDAVIEHRQHKCKFLHEVYSRLLDGHDVG